MRMNKRIRGDNASDRAGQEGGTGARVSLALTRTVQPSVAPARSVVALGALEAALLAFLHSKTPASLVPVERRIFLSMSESAKFRKTGLSTRVSVPARARPSGADAAAPR
jgi:hypothetical protein